MAWHVFEKLLEGVANYSTFIGKLWITFFFIFRIIIVASVGDTVYSDEQSAFICNTLQPGCTNVCFNRFSPISQIRFWAVQILFVGMPSVIFIVFAMHKMSSLSMQEKDDDDRTSRSDRHSEGKLIEYDNNRGRRRKYENNENTSEKSLQGKGSSNQTSLPQYDDLAHGKEKRPVNGMVRIIVPNKKPSSSHSNESVYSDKRLAAQIIVMEPGKKKIQRKTVYNKDGTSEVVKTPSIALAYFAQTIITTCIEAVFIFLQYSMYRFEVHELYVCVGDPCPKQVDCYVSRPKEKTLFLLFMYVMSSVSILINVIELLHLIRKYAFGSDNAKGGSSMKRLMGHHRLSRGNRGRRRKYNTSRYTATGYPSLGPFPHKNGNSFTDTDDNDSIHSDYSRYYD